MGRDQLLLGSGMRPQAASESGEAALPAAGPAVPAGPAGLDPPPPHLASLAARLNRFAASPPQSLVFEGGDADDRLFMALHWAARLNCFADGPPCGKCPSCIQIAEKVHLDLIVLDGREGGLLVDSVREVRAKTLEPPRGNGTRVIILAEAQELNIAAGNALLKSMEEPRPGNCFVLLAPLRERLLPTLVSRCWVMSLPWLLTHELPNDAAQAEDMRSWLAAFGEFVRTGSGWFERTAVKGRVPRQTAAAVVLAMEREVARALIGDDPSPEAGGLFANMSPDDLRRVDGMLRESQEAITATVNPSLVLDRLAVRVYNWTRGFHCG